jgi:hypothetical protein
MKGCDDGRPTPYLDVHPGRVHALCRPRLDRTVSDDLLHGARVLHDRRHRSDPASAPNERCFRARLATVMAVASGPRLPVLNTTATCLAIPSNQHKSARLT